MSRVRQGCPVFCPGGLLEVTSHSIPDGRCSRLRLSPILAHSCDAVVDTPPKSRLYVTHSPRSEFKPAQKGEGGYCRSLTVTPEH